MTHQKLSTTHDAIAAAP